jgi:hypothetical protein
MGKTEGIFVASVAIYHVMNSVLYNGQDYNVALCTCGTESVSMMTRFKVVNFMS